MLKSLIRQTTEKIKNAYSGIVSILSYEPDAEWYEVPEELYLEIPYVHIGPIFSLDQNDQPVRFLGTGWRTNQGFTITAAHNIAHQDVYRARCYFSDGGSAIFSSHADIPSDFFDEYGTGRKGSIYDIAIMREENVGTTGNGLSYQLGHFNPNQPSNVLGYLHYSETKFYEQPGNLWTISDINSDHIIHSAATSAGFSGGPIIQSGTVVGVHLGGVGLLSDLYPNQEIPAGPYDNAGITINQQILEQLK